MLNSKFEKYLERARLKGVGCQRVLLKNGGELSLPTRVWLPETMVCPMGLMWDVFPLQVPENQP